MFTIKIVIFLTYLCYIKYKKVSKQKRLLLYFLVWMLCMSESSLGIAPTLDWTNFLKIEFVIASGGFYSFYLHQGNKSDKERKIVEKSKVLCIKKDLIHFFESGRNSMWVQFHVFHVGELQMSLFMWTLHYRIVL